ncbi:hypothetical protein BpHYR1_019374 [Brachionus plicatilis]|uniref:Uncharacterized protein n=1 Tax=Brachionus plicatilis TaxID=10195 RepID=A0A3M7PMI0_BRAPC|nr:hypothetical protein BpHYR1_019374 [Brachionus plicatilis]
MVPIDGWLYLFNLIPATIFLINRLDLSYDLNTSAQKIDQINLLLKSADEIQFNVFQILKKKKFGLINFKGNI